MRHLVICSLNCPFPLKHFNFSIRWKSQIVVEINGSKTYLRQPKAKVVPHASVNPSKSPTFTFELVDINSFVPLAIHQSTDRLSLARAQSVHRFITSTHFVIHQLTPSISRTPHFLPMCPPALLFSWRCVYWRRPFKKTLKRWVNEK